MRSLRTLDLSPAIATFLPLVALTFYWYLESTEDSSDEMSALEAWAIPGYMAVILGVQGGMLVAASVFGRRVLGSNLPVCLLAAALFTLNLLSVYLANFGLFLVQEDWIKVAILAASFAVALLLASAIHDSVAMRIGGVAACSLLLAGDFLLDLAFDVDEAAIRRHRAVGELSPGSETDARTVRKVAFEKRPNVYLIAFDALTADAFAERHLRLQAPLAYTEALVAAGAKLLPNAFADREPTRPSLNSLLALDIGHFDGLPEATKYDFFTGRRRSPAGEIFRHNGYRIQTMYKNHYLGRRDGPYVDYYGVPDVASVCDHVESKFTFLGYCTRRMLLLRRHVVPAASSPISERAYRSFVLERIRLAALDSSPWLTLAYMFLPGHPSKTYDHRRERDRVAYRAEFARNAREAAASIEAMMRTIRELDPGAIVLVFGDHGPLMSRGLELDDDPAFYVLDRHAIRMALWPAAACPREVEGAYGSGFVTVASAFRAVITCLAGGTDPVDSSVSYALPYPSKRRFEDFLYDALPDSR